MKCINICLVALCASAAARCCPGDSYIRLDILRNAPLPAGDSTYNSYLITETLDNVRQRMHQLFLTGVK
jgi:hypothetical protein